jgi:uncharacterized protein
MSKRLMIIGVMLLFSVSTAPAQTRSPEALAVARSLISTMKLTDQYKALLPVILLSIKPAVVQGRPEIERDYDAMAAQIADAYAPYYSSMVDSAASLYASNFTVDEMREIDAFYRLPVGQKLLQKSLPITQQSMQIGQDASRKAAEDLRIRLTDLLRQKGHKM